MRQIDREYSTQDRQEVEYLTARGYAFVFTKINEKDVITWKYKKSPELFRLLYGFHKERERN